MQKYIQSSLKYKRRAKRLATLLLAFFLLFVRAPQAASQESESGMAISRTTLLIGVDFDAHALVSLMLIADNPDRQLFAILPIPLGTRVIVDFYKDGAVTRSKYAPVRFAYDAACPDPVGNVVRSVSSLLSGTAIDAVCVFGAQDVENLVNAAGGVRMPASELPSLKVEHESPVYPYAGSVTDLALWLKQELRIGDAVPGYDMDVGDLVNRRLPSAVMNTQSDSALLDGSAAAVLWSYTIFEGNSGTDIMQLRRHQSILTGAIGSFMTGRSDCFKGLKDCVVSGESCFSRLGQYGASAIPVSGIVPMGADHQLDWQTQWVFDTAWLRSWILTNIYLQ